LKYIYTEKELKSTCKTHCDVGLITFVTCYDKGLQVKNFKTKQWLDIEKEQKEKPFTILFIGESFSLLTGGYFNHY
jgi:isopenicillin N synthase-like dioxygenase